jgi:hypothetical protein
MTIVFSNYIRDGYVVIPSLIDGATVEACREHLVWLRAQPASGGPGAAIIPALLGRDPFADELAGDRRLVGLASTLLRPVERSERLSGRMWGRSSDDGVVGGHGGGGSGGGDAGDGSVSSSGVVSFGFTYIVKAAGTGLPALWHQDGHPWRERFGIDVAVTLWVALDPVDAGNGALQVLPGSHSTPARPLAAREGGGGLFGGGIDPGPFDSCDVETLVMAPGDVSAHHPGLVHGSGANRSSRHRRALAVRYRPA